MQSSPRRFGILVSLLAAFATSCAAADEFSWELRGGVRDADLDPSADAEGATLTATYFVRPVDDADGPYALAPFLSRRSHLGASYGEDKTTVTTPVMVIAQPPFVAGLSPSPPVTVVSRGARRALSGRYVSTTTGWFAGAALAESVAAQPAPLPSSFSGDDLETAALSGGKYFGRTTTVELSLERAETGLAFELPVFCTSSLCSVAQLARSRTNIESELTNVGISAFHVGRLGRMRYSLAGGVTTSETTVTIERSLEMLPLPLIAPAQPLRPAGGFNFAGGVAVGPATDSRSGDRRERYSLAGELFPTRAIGIRVGYARWDGDQSLDKSYELGATWFFRPRVGARAVISRSDSKVPVSTADDTDTVTFELIGRL